MKTREVLKNAVYAAMTLAIAGLAAGVGCSMDNPAKNRGTFSVKIEDDPNAPRYYSLAQGLDLLSMSSQLMSNIAPTSTADFNCFAVNVTGPGIVSNNKIGPNCTILGDNMHGRGVGIISEPVQRGKIIELDVLPGGDRRVDVYGVFPPTQECGGGMDVASEGRGYYLGGKTVEIRENTQVTVQAAYQSGQPHSVSCIESVRMRMSAFGYQNFGHKLVQGQSPQSNPTPTPVNTNTGDYDLLKDPNDTYLIHSETNSPGFDQYAFNVSAIDFSKFGNVSIAFKGYAGVDSSCTGIGAVSSGSGSLDIWNPGSTQWQNVMTIPNQPSQFSPNFYKSPPLGNPSQFRTSSFFNSSFIILRVAVSAYPACIKTDYIEIELAK